MPLTKDDISGVYTAIVTPFDADGAIDFNTLGELVRFQFAQGAAGIVPIGGTGEYPALSREERRDVVAACVEASDGRPILPGILATGFHDALDAGRDFAAAGASGLMLVTPFYAAGPQEGMRRYYANFRAEVDLPLLAYDIPRRTGVAMTAETVQSLAGDGSIIGIKCSSYDVPVFIDLARHGGDSLAVLSGEEPLFATHVALGAKGGVLASASIHPRIWIAIFELARKGRLTEALAMQTSIDPVLGSIYRETNPGPLKAYMKMMGRPVGGVRLPLTEPSDDTMRALREAADRMSASETT